MRREDVMTIRTKVTTRRPEVTTRRPEMTSGRTRAVTMQKLTASASWMWIACLCLCLCISTPVSVSATFIAPPTTPNPSPRSPPSSPDLWHHLPASWASFCTLHYDLDPEVSATVRCRPTPQQQPIWSLADFRQALTPVVTSLGLEIAVEIRCETGGVISLPLPYRAPGLVKLTVQNCRLTDRWTDLGTPAHYLPDSLRVLDLRDCVALVDTSMSSYVLQNAHLLDSHFDCGQDSTLVIEVTRNISQEMLAAPVNISASLNQTDSLLDLLTGLNGTGSHNTSADSQAGLPSLLLALNGSSQNTDSFGGGGNSSVAADVLNTLIKLDNISTTCNYEHLEVLDESFSQSTSTSHFEFMVRDSHFPKLRVLNETGIGLREIPLELREWRRKFPRSPLEVIDLSHNYVQQLGRIPMYPSSQQGLHTRLVLRHNNVSQLSLQMFQELARVPDFSVDLEGNPISCHCAFRGFLQQLRNASLWSEPAMARYRRHVQGLACFRPPELRGRTVGSLRDEDLDCPLVPADLRPALIVTIALMLLLLALLVLAVKFRKEVRILLYTRVHVLLPCGGVPLPQPGGVPKTFDAFVAYAHQDSAWVLESLLPRLEQPRGGGPACKLCIHQRDFVVGKAIIDNIVDSIAASRHTIVVLSRSFVRSGWAMEELVHAYRQSMEERRRHLVVVVLEDVAQEDMDPVLRRCTKTFTYLNVSDTFFWDRLLYSIQVGSTEKAKPLKQAAGSDDAQDFDDICNNKTGGTKSGGSVNKGYNCGDEERGEGEITPPQDPAALPDHVKRALFSDSMRTLSVESSLSDSSAPLSPSQPPLDRPLFQSTA